MKNWLDNFEIRLIHYDTFIECKCSVHRGFYNSALSITNKTIETIHKLKQKYSAYQYKLYETNRDEYSYYLDHYIIM